MNHWNLTAKDVIQRIAQDIHKASLRFTVNHADRLIKIDNMHYNCPSQWVPAHYIIGNNRPDLLVDEATTVTDISSSPLTNNKQAICKSQVPALTRLRECFDPEDEITFYYTFELIGEIQEGTLVLCLWITNNSIPMKRNSYHIRHYANYTKYPKKKKEGNNATRTKEALSQ